ncbi:MAG: amidohydrolase family protein [Patescibacteria group bacterium]|jgi:dihydroorotase
MRVWDDFHVHLRYINGLLPVVLPYTAAYCQRGLVMPNTDPAIADHLMAARYGKAIRDLAPGFTPLLSLKLLPTTTWETISYAARAGVTAVKLYPKGPGGTTGAQASGVDINDLEAYDSVFEAMQQFDLVLCVHGEVPWVEPEFGERAFLPIMDYLVERYPRLRIVFEHVSSEDGVRWVERAPKTVAATVTPHHPILTAADILDGPHHCCKPPLKGAEHRAAIRGAMFSGNPKFFFGSDSAPHPDEAKKAIPPANGQFNAPVAPGLLMEEFVREFGDVRVAIGRLESFTSEFGADFYRLERNTGKIWLKNEPWVVPMNYHGITPMCPGRTVGWQLAA